MRSWTLWIGVLISTIFLYLALRGLELGEVWVQLRAAEYWWILPGIAIYFVGVWARTWRWHYMLRPIKPMSLRSLFPVVCIGYMGNNIYPARAGEVLRAYVLKRKEGISMSASLATVLVERLFDGLVILLFVFIALPFANLPTALNQLVSYLSLAFVLGLLTFIWVALNPVRVRRIYEFLAHKILPMRIRSKTDGLFVRFMTGLAALRNGRDVLMIFVTSTCIWLAETIKYYLVMQAFPFAVSFFVLMLINGVVNLATSIPAAPGYIGTFDLPSIEILSSVGVGRDLAVAYTGVLHASLWLPITMLGIFFFWRERLRWQDIQHLRQQARATRDDAPDTREAEIGV